MKPAIAVLAAASVLVPCAAGAQEVDVARRSFTFIENRLEIAVLSGTPGELQVLRGERGRVDAAAHTSDGVAAFGLGGAPSRQLRLTAAGAAHVSYVVVVPEHVAVRVVLPDGSSADLPPRNPAGAYRWGAVDEVQLPDGRLHRSSDGAPPPPAPQAPQLPARPGSRIASAPLPLPSDAPDLHPDGNGTAAGQHPLAGPAAINGSAAYPAAAALPLVHRSGWVPAVIDVPDLTAVRSLTIRVAGDEFQVAASRPLLLQPGSRSRMELRLAGEPIDLVFQVPPSARVELISGSTVIARTETGRALPLCGNVVIVEQNWLRFHPQLGVLDCR